MQKVKVIIFLCLSITIHSYCQRIIEVNKDKENYHKLGKGDKVYFVKKDSIREDSSRIKSTEELLLIGKCNNWNEETCGILSLSIFAEKTAKARGYNAVSVNFYRGTPKEDTLSVIFYRLWFDKIRELENNEKKYITLINLQNSSDKDLEFNGKSMTLSAGTYLQKEVKIENMKLKFGKGVLASKVNIDFEKINKLYLITDRYHLTGPFKGVGVGFSGTFLMAVSPLSGEIMMSFLSKSNESD